MENLKKALEMLNTLPVVGIDNCLKMSFIGQLIKESIIEMEKGDANGEQHK